MKVHIREICLVFCLAAVACQNKSTTSQSLGGGGASPSKSWSDFRANYIPGDAIRSDGPETPLVGAIREAVVKHLQEMFENDEQHRKPTSVGAPNSLANPIKEAILAVVANQPVRESSFMSDASRPCMLPEGVIKPHEIYYSLARASLGVVQVSHLAGGRAPWLRGKTWKHVLGYYVDVHSVNESVGNWFRELDEAKTPLTRLGAGSLGITWVKSLDNLFMSTHFAVNGLLRPREIYRDSYEQVFKHLYDKERDKIRCYLANQIEQMHLSKETDKVNLVILERTNIFENIRTIGYLDLKSRDTAEWQQFVRFLATLKVVNGLYLGHLKYLMEGIPNPSRFFGSGITAAQLLAKHRDIPEEVRKKITRVILRDVLFSGLDPCVTGRRGTRHTLAFSVAGEVTKVFPNTAEVLLESVEEDFTEQGQNLVRQLISGFDAVGIKKLIIVSSFSHKLSGIIDPLKNIRSLSIQYKINPSYGVDFWLPPVELAELLKKTPSVEELSIRGSLIRVDSSRLKQIKNKSTISSSAPLLALKKLRIANCHHRASIFPGDLSSLPELATRLESVSLTKCPSVIPPAHLNTVQMISSLTPYLENPPSGQEPAADLDTLMSYAFEDEMIRKYENLLRRP